MPTYNFEVRTGETIHHCAENVSLENPSQVWGAVEELSRRFDDRGSRIVVRDETEASSSRLA